MLHGESPGLLLGAVALGLVHGIEPGHGWPVAASYALDQSSKWLYGLAASLTIGIGHLVSSIAMVAVFFYAKSYFQLTQVNDPLALPGGVEIGGPVSLVAGILLILLGIREYRHGHGHDHGHGHGTGGEAAHSDHGHDYGHGHGTGGEAAHSDHDHGPSETQEQTTAPSDGESPTHAHAQDSSSGLWHRLRERVPSFNGGSRAEATDRGMLGIAWFAFVLGFAHEEEFEIIALCAGSTHCLELMSAYALTVILGIVGLTLLLIAGYQRHEERVERYSPYLPVFSAVVLTVMGIGFIAGIF